MTTSLQIFLGLVLCGAGITTFNSNPFAGCGTIFLGGALILGGFDRRDQSDGFERACESGGTDES